MAYATWEDARDAFMLPFAGIQTEAINFYNRKLNLVTDATLTAVKNTCKYCFDRIYNIIEGHMSLNWLDPVADSAHYQAINMISAGSVDMQAIIDAMMAATYTEISEYLSIQWAFQHVMWEQPFNSTAYSTIVNTIRT